MDALIRPATEHPVQEINTTTDTRDYLAKSRQDAERKGYADWLIVEFTILVIGKPDKDIG